MPRNDEITISGVTWRIPRLLKYIADTMSEREGCNPVPTPPPEPVPPTRFSIHWTFGGRGEWLGYLVAHWDSEFAHKSHEYNTCILRITVDHATGNFGSTCILEPKRLWAVSPTLDECKVDTDNMIMSMVVKLHTLCIKEDYNKVKTLWWE